MANLSRRIYNSQTLTIPGLTAAVPVKNISISRERPMEPILGLGVLKGANQAQRGFETFKIDVKCFLTASGMSSSGFKSIFLDVEKGIHKVIKMDPGFDAQAFLTGLTIDSSVGEFTEVGLSFQGIGNPDISTTTAAIGADVGGAAAATVLDSSNVTSVDPFGTTVKSAKFSFQMKTETIAQISTQVFTNSKSIPTSRVKFIAKPPYQASLSFEGTSLIQITNATNRGAPLPVLDFGGGMVVTLQNAVLKSFSTSQTPGEIGAAFSASYEGTSVSEFF